jgi:hypothetical protein
VGEGGAGESGLHFTILNAMARKTKPIDKDNELKSRPACGTTAGGDKAAEGSDRD